EVYVLALADERRGWRLLPVIEKAESGEEEAVELLNRRLPGFARLDPPRLVTELPRTGLGKIDLARLREEIAKRTG
ncbi:MAG: 2,3-dihydroxybenzoate-AMP ligase, partial [Akkermansiaceae bacterium]|nr:2,3-dihydroxybenzoate-AMP ligase [Akkermansiaceae bacterium]